MKRKGYIICGIAAGLVIIMGIAIFFILTRSENPTLAVLFKKNPYKSGYVCTGTGELNVELDAEKLKKTPGFPEDEAGDLFINVLKNNTKSMSMEVSYNGEGMGTESNASLKLSSGGLLDYRSDYYTDGTKKWVKTSNNDQDGKWTEIQSLDGIESLTTSINLERLGSLKDLMQLTAQDENSSTFYLKITGHAVELLFGPEGKEIFKNLAGDVDFDEFVESMKMAAEIKTSKKINMFTPYVGISQIKFSFILPYNCINSLLADKKPDGTDQVEKDVLECMKINGTFSACFSYEGLKIEKPVFN